MRQDRIRFKLLKYIAAGVLLSCLIYSPLSTVFAAPPYDGGSGDGWGVGSLVDSNLGGPSINFASQSDQTFQMDDTSTAIARITIYQESNSGITASDDIRIRIPQGLEMKWDVTDTEAVLGGGAAGKVSNSVSYEETDKTLVLDVLSDFAMDDSLTIEGLSFCNFTAVSSGRLGLGIYGAGKSHYFDTKTISIEEALPPPPPPYTAGDGWAYASSRSRCLTSPAITAPAGGERWVVDSSQAITWSTSGFSGTTLKLQYSTDDFASDINSISGASSLSVDSGTFNWTIPNDIYPAVKVRFIDNDNPDVTDASEEFGIIGAFSLTAPNGGESWAGGSTQNITWTTTGTILSIKLEYSIDNFVSDVHTIGSPPILNENTYSWTVPAIVSNTVRVRISDNSDSTVYDTSDANFAITGLEITAPNGGEEWEVGYSHNITWKSGGTVSNDIVIEYSTDGSTYNPIDSGQKADGTTYPYPWTIPNDVSETVKVKVYSVSAETIYDISDANFSIAVNPSMAITAPNGTEAWEVGKSYNITWNKTGNLYDTVDLYYSTNGTTWTEIALAQTNSGTYAWDVADAVGTTVKVKVIESAVPAGRDTTTKVEDTSDANFSIVEPTITITAPNGGEVWAVGNIENITWTSEGTVSSNLLLEYSTDGTTYNPIATGEGNDGSYTWTIPEDPSETLKVRITDNNRTQVNDASDNYFTILSRPRVTITQPNGGELLTIGDSYFIKWTIDGQITSHYVKIEYSKDDFASDVHTISSYTPNDGEFTWLSVADDSSSTVKVRISDLETDFEDVLDTSDNYFEIRQPSVTVTSPNGGESWYATGEYPITWSKEGAVGSLTLEYSLNDGGSWTTIATNIDVDLGAYTWTVADSLSSQCLIRIKDPLRATTTDISDGNFSIIAPSITLTAPNGGEAWIVGTSHQITWTSAGTNGSLHNNLTLQYSKNGTDWIGIATGETNDGEYTWTIPDDVSSTVKVKLFDASRTGTVDTSDANFSIASPTLTITSPNGGEEWVIGTSHNIIWASAGSISTNNIKLEYSINGGVSWTDIATGEVNDGGYTWTVPDAVSGTSKIRITDTGRADTPQDTSDGVFAIVVPRIAISAPNGGEIWTVGDVEVITWSVVGSLSGNLKLEYSKDNFVSDTHLIDGAVANTLTSYNWTIPNDVSSTVRVRITDLGQTASTDKSDTDFTISPAPEITVTAPNGGESWIIGTEHNITWTDNGGIISNNLTLEYTTDGATYNSIATGEANDGSYTWTIPDEASDTAQVRITDANRFSTTDLSNNYFSIAVPTITITSPNGGEYWAVGDAAPVTWASLGSVSDDLVFYYSIDGGSSWTTITSGETNDGSYTWTVPNEPSSLVQFKIVDGVRPASSDTSDSNFTIIPLPTLIITAPNGGETYVLGETMNITWTSQGLSIGMLKIEYSADGFATASTIVQDTANSGSYEWTIPDDALSGSTIKVRITDQVRPEITDTSDSTFRIRGGFTLSAPNGGEEWGAKSSQTISWTTYGTIANVKLEYSLDSGSTWTIITSSAANTDSYAWTLPDVQKTTCRVRISDITDSTVNISSAADFSIIYYMITWNILDYDTYSHLRNLNVNCSSGWIMDDASLTSPISHSYSYGTYTTFWSKAEYIERATSWTADSTKSVTLYLESTISAQIEWHVLLSTSYAAASDTLKISCWLERRGKMVGLTSVERTDLKEAILQVYEGNTLVKQMSSTSPDNQGTFGFSWVNTALEAGKTYFVKAQIKYRESTYTSGGSVDVTEELKQYEQKVQLQTLRDEVAAKATETQTAVATKAAETQAAVTTKAAATQAMVTTKAAETQSLVATKADETQEAVEAEAAETQTMVQDKAEETIGVIGGDDLKTGESIASRIAVTTTSRILNQESYIRQNDILAIRYKTDPGLSPVISVYDPYNRLRVTAEKMEETIPGESGIYEYKVRFVWGRGEYTVICKEEKKGTLDGINIEVISTDLENLSSDVTTATAQLMNIDTDQIEMLSGRIAEIGTFITKIIASMDEVAGLSARVKELTDKTIKAIYEQLEATTKKLKEINENQGIKIEKMYDLSEEQATDVDYIKNKTLEIRALVELSQDILSRGSDEPIVKSWLENE